MKVGLPKRKMTRRELALAGVASAVLAIFIAQSFLRALKSDIRSLDKRIVLEESRLLLLKGILARENSFEKEYELAVAASVPAGNAESLLGQIGEIARQSGFTIVNMKPTNVRNEEGYQKYSIDIEGKDEVSSFAGFLHALTIRMKQVGVERIAITTRPAASLPDISLRLSAIILTS